MSMRTRVPLALLIGLQALDVFLHVITDQFEVIRVASNVIIGVGALSAIVMSERSEVVILSATVAYLVLNIVFVFHNGAFNPASGAPRVPLFAFVMGSLFLANWLRIRAR